MSARGYALHSVCPQLSFFDYPANVCLDTMVADDRALTVIVELWLLPSPFAGLCTMYVGQLADTEAVYAAGVGVAVDGDGGTARRHLERLAHLLVQLKIRDRAPELGRCNDEKRRTHLNKGKLGANAMKHVAAGAHLTTL